MKSHLLSSIALLLAITQFNSNAIRVLAPRSNSHFRDQSGVTYDIGKAKQISPSGSISTTTPSYMWNAVALATWYRLWVNDSAVSQRIFKWYKAEEVGCASGTGTCSITPEIKLAAGICKWWVQTYDTAEGPWSDGMEFTVSLVAPPKATLMSPSGNISTSNPTYTWNAVSSASWYLLWVNDSKTQGKVNQWCKAAEAGCASGVGTCSVTPSRTLASGAAQWWIQTWNDYGYGPWSDAMSFVIGASTPGKATLVSPNGAINTRTPAYTWNAISNASWYQLWVDDSSAQGRIKNWYTAAQAACSSGSGTCSVTPDTALAIGNCQWWIQTWNEFGNGPWSEGMSFAISPGGPPGKATLISPSGSIWTKTPTYTWNAVANATWYYLNVEDSSATSAKINIWYTAAEAGCASGTGTCSVKPATSLVPGAAQWWIQTWNDRGYGPWSDALTFTVATGTIGPYGIEFVSIPAGEFQMGASNGEVDELPVHRVEITRPFEMGACEITQDQWQAVMGNNPSSFKGDHQPVETVSWNDVQQFIAKLNALKDGYSYRLPTEAEWEYACRAGTTGDYAGNLDDMAWYYQNSGGKTHVVGTKERNAWGLYDMHGNVWEWVQDWYNAHYYSVSPTIDPKGPSSGTEKAERGGGWYDIARGCRSSDRRNHTPDTVRADLGFRVVRTSLPNRGIILLKRSSSDSMVDYFRSLLDSKGYSYTELLPSQVSAASLSNSVIVAGFAAEPTEFQSVAGTIKDVVSAGSWMLAEGYGCFLLHYAGIGKAGTDSWSPVANDYGAFVRKVDDSPLFALIPTWDPPNRPDQPDQYTYRLIRTGFHLNPSYTAPSSGVSFHRYWSLFITYGSYGLDTSSGYCQNWGGCTKDRSVEETGIHVIEYGAGRIMLFNGIPHVPNDFEYGPITALIYKNYLDWALAN